MTPSRSSSFLKHVIVVPVLPQRGSSRARVCVAGLLLPSVHQAAEFTLERGGLENRMDTGPHEAVRRNFKVTHRGVMQ
jgi:hypothetical protein